MLARERPIVHFVAHQRLRMHRRGHIERRGIIVGAFEVEKFRARIRAGEMEEIGETRAAEAADDVPALDADVARVLSVARKRLNLGESVFAGLGDVAGDFQFPGIEIHAGIVDVVIVDRKFLEGRDLGIRKVGARCERRKKRDVAQS